LEAEISIKNLRLENEILRKNLLQQNEILLQKETVLLQQEAILLQQEATLLQQNEILLQKETVLLQQEAILLQQEATLLQQEVVLLQQETDIVGYKATIAQYQRMLFGQKRERFTEESPIQIKLDFGQEITAEDAKKIEQIITHKQQESQKKQQKTSKPSPRIPFPSHLEVKITRIKPQGDLSDMVLVREETAEFLEFQPAKYFIHRIVREVYAPRSKEGSFLVGPLSDSVFEKSKVGVGLVAHLLYSKFVLHLPIDRLFHQMIRAKIPTNSGTLYNWVKLGIERLEVLYEHQFQKLILKKYLQVDETTLKVLENHQKKAQCHLGYFWVYNDPISGQVLFKYERGRDAKFPEEVLQNFAGYLQTDGYSGYDALAKKETICRVACWAHARRKFEEALKNDHQKASIALKLIQELYAIEREAKEFSAEDRKTLRLNKALPVYNLLGKFIASNLKNALPKSSIGTAMNYALNRWEELGNYMLDGNLEIDNNLVENAIRPVAIGRKNYLFAGTHESAQRNAIMYTFMADCKKHNVNPEQWLNWVLEKIPNTNIKQLDKLMPKNFHEQHGAV
jgi:transposase